MFCAMLAGAALYALIFAPAMSDKGFVPELKERFIHSFLPWVVVASVLCGITLAAARFQRKSKSQQEKNQQG